MYVCTVYARFFSDIIHCCGYSCTFYFFALILCLLLSPFLSHTYLYFLFHFRISYRLFIFPLLLCICHRGRNRLCMYGEKQNNNRSYRTERVCFRKKICLNFASEKCSGMPLGNTYTWNQHYHPCRYEVDVWQRCTVGVYFMNVDVHSYFIITPIIFEQFNLFRLHSNANSFENIIFHHNFFYFYGQ